MPNNEYSLDSMVCFAIYSASNAVAKAHRVVLEPWELTYTQYIVLLETNVSADGISVSELGARMNLDSGTLSPLLRRLDARGLVSRVRRSPDERVVTVEITATGAAMLQELRTALHGLRGAYGFDSQDQADHLVKELHRITEGMRHLTASTHDLANSPSRTLDASSSSAPKGNS
ncbi:MarR family winged helix-turn-helix transcriptional regulator [Arthrobacter glacialis]|uniref:MarR family transcriptional regulator n=1 Tax=Arthrobacter glacialis TaxID=1664 RepID=A0A2S3ZRM2_ARTGL|nr:MarR family winged helix-turn-helix transcriptional regulator [Arthrobacter glacialis]POH57656.1 MarR family transcriptional regulator [Arthrobacter glacialis]POH71886.1 MarR family transcriptional regulator [Arthrobacter glacialis]